MDTEMNIESIKENLDKLYMTATGDEIRDYINSRVVEAMESHDTGIILFLLNELIGSLRTSEKCDDAIKIADKAIDIINSAGIAGTVYHATTLINKANALRAAGRTGESIEVYNDAKGIYEKVLPLDSFEFASLYNNLSLTYMEINDEAAAGELLQKALEIVTKYSDKGFEKAVTLTNLGNCEIRLPNRKDEAKQHLNEAISYFEENGIADEHYGAAVLGIGEINEQEDNYDAAFVSYQKAMSAVLTTYGYTDHFYRIKDRYDRLLEKKPELKEYYSAINIAKRLWNIRLKPEFDEKFGIVMQRAAVGLAGYGSDCYGYEDIASRDHDWGPGVCIWLPKEEFTKYSKQMQELYDELTKEPFEGYKRNTSSHGNGRVGVISLDDFVSEFVGDGCAKLLFEAVSAGVDITKLKGNRHLDQIWLSVPETGFGALINGELFESGDGVFERVRHIIKGGYPKNLMYLKLAQNCALFSQNLQYNYRRMCLRNDMVSTKLMLANGVKAAYGIIYGINSAYLPHDKWIPRAVTALMFGAEVGSYIEKVYAEAEKIQPGRLTERGLDAVVKEINELAWYLIDEMRRANVITHGHYGIKGNYIEDIAAECALRAGMYDLDKKILVENIVHLEWDDFDKVINEGGRADCQDNWNTFSLMRRSQYNTWEYEMLVQYAVDFNLAKNAGWNLIMEKYGRMEESTAPDKWDEIKDSFPIIDDEKKQIIEGIVSIQVGWMEEFAGKYPNMAQNARSIHTYEDNAFNTSYETYLRGEISTYSDTMLYMYGRFIATLASENGNLAYMIMNETALQYGYNSVEDAENALRA